MISSIPLSYCGLTATTCFTFLSGTSMATPHLAGTAAVVRGAHPTWTAAQVRSAITNTARQGVVDAYGNPGTPVTDVNIVGAGLADVDAALAAQAAIGPVSTSFGAVSVGPGQTRTASVAITNLTAGSKTFLLAIANTLGAGVSFALGQSSVTLAARASTSVTVTMTAVKGAALGDHQARLTVSSGGSEVAHAAVYAFVK